MSEAWEALRAAEEQRHSEAPHRRAEVAESAVLKSQNDSETHTSATELIKSLSVNHLNHGDESSEGRFSVAAVRSTAVSPACCRSDTEDGCRAEPARSQRRGTHLGFGTFGTEGERTGLDPGGGRSC